MVAVAVGAFADPSFPAPAAVLMSGACMGQMANPGSVLTTADTLQLAEGYVATKPLGPVPVKGLADLVEIYEVTGAGPARTRLEATAGRGLTRFVGRDIELERLLRAQALAGRGCGQVVAIIGDAGVGKSRLVHEFLHSRHTADWLVLESNTASYGRATPYRMLSRRCRCAPKRETFARWQHDHCSRGS